jgi:ubiquinone/menaquinone biosynthesis C-methylase UbiE
VDEKTTRRQIKEEDIGHMYGKKNIVTGDKELRGEYYKSYLGTIAKRLNNSWSIHGAHHRNLNIFIHNQINRLQKDALVLDAGCGLSAWLTPDIENKIKYTGIDCQEDSILCCKEMFPKRDYRSGDVYQLPYPDHSFDAIVMREVIEHIKKPEKAVKEVRRVLKPNGLYILTTPNYGNPLLYVIEHTYNRFFGGPCKPYLPDVHPSRFKRSLLSDLLIGFEGVIIETVSFGISLTAVARKP